MYIWIKDSSPALFLQDIEKVFWAPVSRGTGTAMPKLLRDLGLKDDGMSTTK